MPNSSLASSVMKQVSLWSSKLRRPRFCVLHYHDDAAILEQSRNLLPCCRYWCDDRHLHSCWLPWGSPLGAHSSQFLLGSATTLSGASCTLYIGLLSCTAGSRDRELNTRSRLPLSYKMQLYLLLSAIGTACSVTTYGFHCIAHRPSFSRLSGSRSS